MSKHGQKLRLCAAHMPLIRHSIADKPLRVKDTVNILRGTVQQEGQQDHE